MRARWWPLLLIATLAVLASAWIWFFVGPHRQARVLATIVVAGAAGISSLVWLLAFSRLGWKVRLGVFAAIVAIAALAAASLERQGVTGDVVPVFAWRWAARPTPAELPAPARLPAEPAVTAIDPATDYPQFGGPRRDAIVERSEMVTDWSARPPRELWRRTLGEGWSGFAVAGPYAVTQEQRGPEEVVSCYDRRTGVPIWAHRDHARHDDPLGGPGPRATPTIDRGRVFTFGATGLLNALDLATGARIWAVDVMEDNGAFPPPYGVAASPLVVGNAVVVAAGGPSGRSLVAYDVATGARVWSGGDDRAAYSSPVRAMLAGHDQIVWLSASALVGFDAGDGSLSWRFPWPGGTENVSQPVIVGGQRVIQSTGYGVGAKSLRVSDASGAMQVELEWETLAMKAKLSNVVLRDGYLYGLDDGILACVDAESGTRMWKRGRYGHGQLVLVADVLLIQAESGSVVLVRATPDGHRELARLDALDSKTWNPPALAGRQLLVRNDREGVCYELP